MFVGTVRWPRSPRRVVGMNAQGIAVEGSFVIIRSLATRQGLRYQGWLATISSALGSECTTSDGRAKSNSDNRPHIVVQVSELSHSEIALCSLCYRPVCQVDHVLSTSYFFQLDSTVHGMHESPIHTFFFFSLCMYR